MVECSASDKRCIVVLWVIYFNVGWTDGRADTIRVSTIETLGAPRELTRK